MITHEVTSLSNLGFMHIMSLTLIDDMTNQKSSMVKYEYAWVREVFPETLNANAYYLCLKWSWLYMFKIIVFW
jgi:hypothetical protein